MLSFNNLKYYSIPPLENWTAPEWLRTELGLLSGRLYFDFDDYALLGDTLPAPGMNDGISRTRLDRSSQSTLAFLRDWLAVRRSGQDISHTPMGYLCDGKRFSADHPFFTARKVESTPPNVFHRLQAEDVEEDMYGSGDSDDGDGGTDLNEH